MENWLKIAPLAALLAGVGIIVWRGMGTKKDPDSNRSDIGGGSGDRTGHSDIGD